MKKKILIAIIILIVCYCLFWICERIQGVLDFTVSDNCMDVQELFFIMPDNDWGHFSIETKKMTHREAEKALASCRLCLRNLDDGQEYVLDKRFKNSEYSDYTEFIFSFSGHWKGETSIHIPAGDCLLTFEQESLEIDEQNPFEGRPLTSSFWANRKHLRPWWKRLKQKNITLVHRGKGWNKESLWTFPD